MELKDKTIIITGASSGIGASAAGLFAAEGANVILGARREDFLKAQVQAIQSKGGSACYMSGDVCEADYSQALVDLAISRYGRLDGALNNAGMMGDMCPLPDMSVENWNMVLATNLTSAFHAAKSQIPILDKQGGGSLVFTSSFVGFSNGGMPGMGAYAASKAGMVGLVKSLASDYASEQIRINALLPGGTQTAMAGDDPAGHEFIAGLHPMKRMASPIEIAQTALFLLSDRSSFITGSPLIADGGVSVRLT